MESFASGVGLYKMIWIFFIGGVLGTLVETAWCYINEGFIESRRGLIYSPTNPVYGIGAIVLVLALHRIEHLNGIIIFLISAVIGGAFEAACSWVQEKAFGTVSWEYSHTPLNFGGRTNMAYSAAWGLLGFVFIRHTFPYLSGLIEKIPVRVGVPLTWVFSALLLGDMFISAAAVFRQKARRAGYAPANAFTRFLDRHYTDAFLLKVYPNMITVTRENGRRTFTPNPRRESRRKRKADGRLF